MKNELGIRIPPDELRHPTTAAGYLGDYLRGNVPINQLIPQHEYIVDTLKLGEEFKKNTKHMMLLTLDEADAILNELLIFVDPVTTYAGNIKDGFDGVKNISKLTSFYNDVDKLLFNFKGLGIKAIPFTLNGVTYLKVTGYSGIRRILKGTKYGVSNPEVLELSVGKLGRNSWIIGGARFCVWFSLAYRAIEFIFRDSYTVIDFVGDIEMDFAKIIVSIFLAKIIFAIGARLAVAAGVALLAPISVGIGITLVVGIGISIGLSYLDERYQLSSKLKLAIKDGMDERRKIEEWNQKNSSLFSNSFRFGF